MIEVVKVTPVLLLLIERFWAVAPLGATKLREPGLMDRAELPPTTRVTGMLRVLASDAVTVRVPW
jgi:hypothetical protein